ncbi:hypothetical protein [Burkholderia gladioli]|uniref:hypothetical protein n=1 Tax=Burkholderia gladioli TaxID=28095 RepID=UPI001641CB4A|nr:hypothetical protein [Burkholderia gladioli]
MGTERSTEFDAPCLCGAGTFHIDDCSPDHGWPTATPQWYEASIRCPKCSHLYELQQRGKRFVLIERVEIEAALSRRDAASAAGQALMGRQEVTEALVKYASYIDGLPSKAAILRQLVADGFSPGSIATFRKRWRGASNFLHIWAHPGHLPAVFSAVGLSIDELRVSLHEYDLMVAAASVEPQPFGRPVYESRRGQ